MHPLNNKLIDLHSQCLQLADSQREGAPLPEYATESLYTMVFDIAKHCAIQKKIDGINPELEDLIYYCFNSINLKHATLQQSQFSDAPENLVNGILEAGSSLTSIHYTIKALETLKLGIGHLTADERDLFVAGLSNTLEMFDLLGEEGTSEILKQPS